MLETRGNNEPESGSNRIVLDIIRRAYELIVTGANFLQSPLLLALRVYFFWQLFLTGKGKLSNIGKVSEFFTSLGIPLPTLNAYFIGSLECFEQFASDHRSRIEAPVASARDLDDRCLPRWGFRSGNEHLQ
jgi:DoxX